jgi:gluconate 5-dehydrogenase
LRKTTVECCFNASGQTAIVTGASSGLGVLYAETLAELGVNLVLAARRYDRLVQRAEELTKKFGVKVIPVQADVTKEDNIQRMVKTAVDNFDSLEILINNAGVASVLPSVDMPLED